MSTKICDIEDPHGNFGMVTVTSFAGPALLGDDRRCIQIDQGDDLLQVSIAQLDALMDQCARQRGRPRAIEAILGRNHHIVRVCTDHIIAIEVESPPVPTSPDPRLSRWRAWLYMGRVIHANDAGVFACYRMFDTEEEAQAFAKGVLG